MDPRRFTNDAFGVAKKEPGVRHAFWYFDPAPIPRSLTLSTNTILVMSKADAALGKLVGVGRLVKDPHVVLHPYLAREAVASSRIEGTQTSLSEVLRAEVTDEPADDEDIQEVANYRAALDHGISLLGRLPLCLRLVREVHGVLLGGVRGKERRPGEFRSSPVWIGGHGDRPDTAAFVPPLPGEMMMALTDWERFMNEDAELPVLVRCALMHYQFETIHPFLDGNGRVGRLMILLMLMAEQVLPMPLLYLSAYMEQNRREYYDHLQAVREEADIQAWLQFFLEAVRVQADDAARRIQNLVDLRERYRSELVGVRSRANEVVELFFSNPFVTVKRVQRALDVTNQGARNLVEGLVKRGWLTPVGAVGRGGRLYWVAKDVYDAVS